MQLFEHRLLARRSTVIAVAICALFANPSLQAKTRILKSEFDVYLSEGYRQMAVVAARAAADHHIIAYYKKRDALVVRGTTVDPEQPDPRALDPSVLHEASYARNDLLARLDAGARQRQPLLAAIAQVNFDCWVVPLPRRPGVPDGDECRRRFYFAFAGLSANPKPLVSAPQQTVERAQLPAATADAPPPIIALRPEPRGAPGRSVQTAVLPPGEIGVRPVGCGTGSPDCMPLAFTGPDADVLIEYLRRADRLGETSGGTSETSDTSEGGSTDGGSTDGGLSAGDSAGISAGDGGVSAGGSAGASIGDGGVSVGGSGGVSVGGGGVSVGGSAGIGDGGGSGIGIGHRAGI
jgi:hypothetical protein